MFDDEQRGVQNFYKSSLGMVFDTLLMPAISGSIGDLSKLNILVIGSRLPSIEALGTQCKSMHYKEFKDNRVFPYSDDSFDRVIVLHSLEFTKHITGFLREVWRVTAPEGRATFLIPNRVGLLVRSDTTPFGYGQPFTEKQFRNILAENQFSGDDFLEVLCMPAWSLKYDKKLVVFLNALGQILWPQLCGAYVVHARKRVFGLDPEAKGARVAIEPVGAPL